MQGIGMSTDRIHVVSAIITRVDDGVARMLFTQRDPKRSRYPWTWECPGGKVDLDRENYREALARELREELGVDAMIDAHPVASFCLEPPTVHRALSILFYEARIGDQKPEPRVTIGLGWFGSASLPHLPLTPGNLHALPYLQAILRGDD
jgi:8-oxo-dGTP pyrophosphatase MutT (NUDIX family)